MPLLPNQLDTLCRADVLEVTASSAVDHELNVAAQGSLGSSLVMDGGPGGPAPALHWKSAPQSFASAIGFVDLLRGVLLHPSLVSGLLRLAFGVR